MILKQPPRLLIDVNGVGYECEAPMSTFYGLPATGDKVTLHTHLIIRDDAHLLYGFATMAEKELFRHLIRVSGVGPKIALAILSGIGVDEFWNSVRNGESLRLTKVPGIGKKSAERLVVELRDKAGAIDSHTAMISAGMGIAASPLQEARSALEALGYKPAEAQRLADVAKGENLTAEEIIREALKHAAR